MAGAGDEGSGPGHTQLHALLRPAAHPPVSVADLLPLPSVQRHPGGVPRFRRQHDLKGQAGQVWACVWAAKPLRPLSRRVGPAERGTMAPTPGQGRFRAVRALTVSHGHRPWSTEDRCASRPRVPRHPHMSGMHSWTAPGGWRLLAERSAHAAPPPELMPTSNRSPCPHPTRTGCSWGRRAQPEPRGQGEALPALSAVGPAAGGQRGQRRGRQETRPLWARTSGRYRRPRAVRPTGEGGGAGSDLQLDARGDHDGPEGQRVGADGRDHDGRHVGVDHGGPGRRRVRRAARRGGHDDA